MEAAIDAYTGVLSSDDCIDRSGAEPVYLGDLTYLLQRRRLNQFGRIHTFVSLVPEGLLVEKAAAQFLNAEIIQAPNCAGLSREHTLFSKQMQALVGTPDNYVVHAEPKWTKDLYSDVKNLSNKGGQVVRFYSVTVAYVLRWGRLRTTLLVSKSRTLPPCRAYSFDNDQIKRLADEYDARVATK